MMRVALSGLSDIDIHMICHFSRRGRGDANPKRRGIAPPPMRR